MLNLHVGIALLLIAISLPVRSEAQDLGGPCIPASERAGRTFGCFIVASLPVGQLERAVFWHVETFASRAAAEKAKSARGVVVEAFDKVWLLTIADAGWRSQGGTHVANIGPVPVKPGRGYTAQFMEAVFSPGMKTRVHRHPGAEAWYTVSGETCLETPDGIMVVVGRIGRSVERLRMGRSVGGSVGIGSVSSVDRGDIGILMIRD